MTSLSERARATARATAEERAGRRREARAHARSGDRLAIAAYFGKSDTDDQAIAEFAAAYADSNERDHQALVQSIAEGKIAAIAGV